jgi:ketopantoate reductase
MKAGVVGLGCVGLPLAVAFAEEAHEVVDLDTDPHKVDALAEHRSYVEDVPSESLAALDGGFVPSRYADLSSAHPSLDYREVVERSPLVLDFRGATRDIEAANLVRL